MSALDGLIKKNIEPSLHEELEERLAIVEHKMKFMDKVMVGVVNTAGVPSVDLTAALNLAGAIVVSQASEADYLIVFEPGKQLGDLMSASGVLLQKEWPAVQQGNVGLLSDSYDTNQPEDMVMLVEDLAELLHPGQFVFGYEGDKWLRFIS